MLEKRDYENRDKIISFNNTSNKNSTQCFLEGKNCNLKVCSNLDDGNLKQKIYFIY